MDAVITVGYSELAGSPHIYLKTGYAEVTRELRCAWNDAITLSRELLGWWSGSTYYRPHNYLMEGNEPLYNVFATDVKIDPYKSPSTSGGVGYSQAKLTVFYTVRDYFTYVNDNIWTEERLDSVSEFAVLDNRNLFFGTGNDAVPVAGDNVSVPARVERMVDWVFTVHNVPNLRSSMFDLQNGVNNAEVSSPSLNLVFPAETLLLGNPTATRELKTTGQNTGGWTMTYRFTYKNNGTFASPKGWNHFARVDGASASGITYERLTNGSVEIPVYPLVNYGDLVEGMW